MDLPAPKNVPVNGYGRISPRLLVIHVSQGPLSDGSGLANYCKSNSGGLRWHRSIGQDGERYRHLDWDEMGAHDSGLNSIAAGIEHVGYVGQTEYKELTKLLWASALEAADFCKRVKKRPSRQFIIGHSEDAKFGGTSTHTDPGGKWPWDLYMQMVEAAYAGRNWEGEDDMSAWADGFEVGQTRPNGEPNEDWDGEKKRGFRAGQKSVTQPSAAAPAEGGTPTDPAAPRGVPAHTHEGSVTVGEAKSK